MKNVILISLMVTSILFAQWDTFSIGYGANQFQSATFINKNILFGFDFIHINVDVSISNETGNYEWDGWNIDYYSDNTDFSVNIFMPRIGARMPSISKNKINTYKQIEGYMIIPFVNLDFEGGDDIEEDIEDALDMFGIKLSYGVEYMFTDQLSISSDVGFNMIFNNFTSESRDEGYNYYEEYSSELKTRVGTTFTKFALNFKL